MTWPVDRIRHKIWKRRRRQRIERQRENWGDAACAFVGGFAGRRVLDVGSDLRGSLPTYVASRFAPEEVVGLNPEVEDKLLAPGCRLLRGDIRSTDFPDGHFDVIVSVSAFEHIHDLDVALTEMHRILKPGGRLYASFGPIWSTSYGHHLGVTYGNRLFTYWNVVLPPYCHLLMSRQELTEHLRGDFEDAAARLIVDYVFESDEQNRMFFEDYESLIRGSDFDVVFMKGYDAAELSAIYNPLTSPETFDRLRVKFPDNSQFSYDGMSVLLAKR